MSAFRRLSKVRYRSKAAQAAGELRHVTHAPVRAGPQPPQDLSPRRRGPRRLQQHRVRKCRPASHVGRQRFPVRNRSAWVGLRLGCQKYCRDSSHEGGTQVARLSLRVAFHAPSVALATLDCYGSSGRGEAEVDRCALGIVCSVIRCSGSCRARRWVERGGLPQRS